MLADLRQSVLSALQREVNATRIVELVQLSGGACQENFRVDVEVVRDADGARSTPIERYVLRSDARASLPGSLSRRSEIEVISAARREGVRTPRPFGLTEGLLRAGASAFFLEWCEGESIGAKVLRDPTLANARVSLPEALAAELAAIHRVTPARAPGLFGGGEPPSDPARAAVDAQRAALSRIEAPHPALELALAWLEDHRPAPSEVTLVHGDFRTGNFLVSPRGLEAVLDWEFAHFGDPLEDLGWLTVRDWRFGQLAHAAGGFATRGRFFSAYEAASGRLVPPESAHFWEVLGNVRWAIGAIVQGLRYTRGETTDLEMIAIGRRAQEMEFEALRLIERGPLKTKGV